MREDLPSVKQIVIFIILASATIFLLSYWLVPQHQFWSDLFANLISDWIVGLLLATWISIYISRYLAAENRRRKWRTALQLISLELQKNSRVVDQLVNAIVEIPQHVKTLRPNDWQVQELTSSLSRMADRLDLEQQKHPGLAHFQNENLSNKILQTYNSLQAIQDAMRLEVPPHPQWVNNFLDTAKKVKLSCDETVLEIEEELISLLQKGKRSGKDG